LDGRDRRNFVCGLPIKATVITKISIGVTMPTQTVVFEREGRVAIKVSVPDTDGNPNHLSPQEIEEARRQALQSLPPGSNIDLFTMVMVGPQVTQVGVSADGEASFLNYRIQRFADARRPGSLPDEEPRPIGVGELTISNQIPAGAFLMVRVDGQIVRTYNLADAGMKIMLNIPAGIPDGPHEVTCEIVEPGPASVLQFSRNLVISGQSPAVQVANASSIGSSSFPISSARVLSPASGGPQQTYVNDPIVVELTSDRDMDVVFQIAGKDFPMHIRAGTHSYPVVGPRVARTLASGLWKGQIHIFFPSSSTGVFGTTPVEPPITILGGRPLERLPERSPSRPIP
jgi:hypothetical protein